MATRNAAAKKPVAASAAVAVRPNTGVVALSERMQGAAVRQREELAKLAGSAKMISFRGGRMTLDGQDLGKEIPIIILATQFERQWYPAAYDPDVKAVPSCYSRQSGIDAAPDERAPYRQSDLCKECQWNEFGSANDGTGKGKACREGYKMAVVHADQAGQATRPPVATVRFSVLNSKDIQKAIQGIYGMVDANGNKQVAHTIQCRTILTVDSDSKRQIINTLKFDGFNPAEVVHQLEPMIDEAEEMLREPYPVDTAVDPASLQEKKGAAKARKATRRF